MKKEKFTILLFCLIYTVLSIVCFVNVKETAFFNIIQFIILYIPFFACIIIEKKKWALYLTLFFSGLEFLTGMFGLIINTYTLIKVSQEQTIVYALIENFLRIIIGGTLISEIISILKNSKKNLNKIIIGLIIILFIVLCYDMCVVTVWAPESKLISALSISRGYLFIIIISLITIFSYYDKNFENNNESN